MKSFVLKGHICYNVSPSEIKTVKSGYVVCKDGISQGVFESLPEEFANYDIYDMGDKLIIPGMIDLHIHASQYAYRGTCMDLELIEWLQEHAFPEEAKFKDLQYADKAYSIFAEEMRKSATTRACIFATRHKDATKVLMDKMEESGLVSYVGKVNMDRNAPPIICEESAKASEAETINWILETKDNYKNTKPIITPRFIPSCTDELMASLGEIQVKYNVPIQSHLSENLSEIELVKELCPDTKYYGDAYDKYGLFGDINANGEKIKTLMAHCIWSSDEELAKMKGNEVFVVHCPASNMNVASGIAPIRKYFNKELKLGLGSDVAGGQTESMFRAITDAIQVSKLYWRHIDQNSKPLTFDEAFYMATLGGGEFFGKVGSFEKGYEFDAVVLDDSILPTSIELNLHDRLERAVYLSLDTKGIIEKYVAGKKVFSNNFKKSRK